MIVVEWGRDRSNDPAPNSPLTQTGDEPMASYRKRGKVWYYRFVDADGLKPEEKGCADKRVTENLARKAESEAAKIKAGILNPRELAYRDHAARSILGHLDDYHAHLIAKGTTPKHADLAVYRARRVIAKAR